MKVSDNNLIRPLNVNDLFQFRRFRLKGIQESPVAFLQTENEFATQSDDDVIKMIAPSDCRLVLGLFDSSESLKATVGFRRDSGGKIKHKGLVWGVYVDPAERGKGYAKLILRSLISEVKARYDLEHLYLTVVTSQTAARKLYLDIRFTIYGFESNSLLVNGKYYDEELMYLKL